MNYEKQENRVARFGVFEVSFRSGELRKAGMRVHIQQKPLKMLEILLERPGDLVSREELRSRLWANESFGDFDQAVNMAATKLRTALGDLAENPLFIETVPKKGYRFIAEVSRPELKSSPGLDSFVPSEAGRNRPDSIPLKRNRVLVSSIAAGFLTVGFAAGIILVHVRRPSNNDGAIQSIAVLPLDNLSTDPSQDYFADGMTDQLITDLAQIRTLRVISRTSAMVYKGQRKALPQIAKELSVDAVVEGSVQRSGNRVRITAQLIRTPADRHLWAETYEGDLSNVLQLEDQVARAVAEQVQAHLTANEESSLRAARTVEPEAYEAWLKGRYFWNKRTADALKTALDEFNKATLKDPGYAPAYSGLADTYSLLGDWQYAVMSPREAMPKARMAAERALQLDEGLSEAHTSLAFCLEGWDWDWRTADREFKRAIELNPNYATGHQWYAWHLALLGRNQEALMEMRKAADLDPLSLIINADLAELLAIVHMPDESIAQSRRTLEMDDNFALAHNHLAQAYLEKGLYTDAFKELKKARTLAPNNPTIAANLARAYIYLGQRSEASHILEELRHISDSSYTHATEIATIYIALGDHDRAMAWLERGYNERFNPGVLLRPGFDPLRSDPRFQTLARTIGLPQ